MKRTPVQEERTRGVQPVVYPSTAKVWQTLNIGKLPRVPNNLIISRLVHGQMPGHCLGVVCQTLPVLR